MSLLLLLTSVGTDPTVFTYGPSDGTTSYSTDGTASYGPSDNDWTLRGLTIGDEA